MPDPLTQMIELLRPQAVFSKGISGAGAWAVQYVDFGRPAFAAMTLGSCRLAVEGEDPAVLEEGDFVLLPATPTFSMSSLEPAPVQRIDASSPPPQHEVRHGRQHGAPEMRQVGGWFTLRHARRGAAGDAAASDDPHPRYPPFGATGADAGRRGGAG